MVIEIKNYEDGNIIEWKWASDNELIPNPFFTSCYFIDGILIDSGAPASVNDLRDFIKSINKEYDIKMCVITHTHEDHCGGAHMLQNEYDIPIYAPKEAIPKLKQEATYPQYRQIAWGEKRKPVNANELPKQVKSSNKSFDFEIFSMPGHAPELVALIEKHQEWVFVSDAIQPRYKMIFGNKSDIQEDISQISESIQKLYDYTRNIKTIKVFISGHNVYNRVILKEKLEEIDVLHKSVHEVYNELSKNYQDENVILRKVLKKIFGKETAVGKLTNGDLSIMNLLKSLLEWPL